jgi:uncharacterized protein YndB with AHSA1/START domain
MKMEKDKIVVKRQYKADLGQIWDLWTTKEGFESWWGPQGFRSEVESLEAKPGGQLRYAMIAATTEMIAAMTGMGQEPSHSVTSTYKELKPRERLVIANVIDFLPGVAPYEADMTVDFSAQGGVVSMVVTLAPLHSEEMSQRQLEGFNSQLSKLDQLAA